MLWNVNQLREHPLRSVSYRAWNGKHGEYVSALEMLHVQGLVLVNGTSGVPIEDVVSCLGPPKNTHWGQSWDVGLEPMLSNPALKSGMALSPSTPFTWFNQIPRLLFLQCVENTVSGGELILVDGMKIAYDMIEFDRTHFEELETYSFRYSHSERVGANSYNFSARRSMISRLLDDAIYCRLDQKFMQTDLLHSANSADDYHKARRALQQYVSRVDDPSNKLVYKMRKGDTRMFSLLPTTTQLPFFPRPPDPFSRVQQSYAMPITKPLLFLSRSDS